MEHNYDCNKNLFWKNNTKPLPGKLSKTQEHSGKKSKSMCSFKDYTESVRDAWDVNESKIQSELGVQISTNISQSAALNVINIHKSGFNNTPEMSKEEPEKKYKYSIRHFPGRPFPFISKTTIPESNKMERFEMTLKAKTVNLEEIRQLSWSGVPSKHRAKTWKILSAYLPTSTDIRQTVVECKRKNYWSLVKQYFEKGVDDTHQDTYRQIHIDIPRTNPMMQLFQQKPVQEMYERILFIWAIRHPASGYVQGMNDLVTPFYVVFLQEFIPNAHFEGYQVETQVETLPKPQRDLVEADTFWCLSRFLDSVQDNYVFAQLGIQKKINQLKDLVQRIDNKLHSHLMNHDVDYLQFSFRWMNNLLSRELPLHCSIRLWDTYLAESSYFPTFHIYVCAAFLTNFHEEIMKEKDFQGIMLFLQNLPTQNWTTDQIGLIIAEAYRLKFTFADAPNHLQSISNHIIS